MDVLANKEFQHIAQIFCGHPLWLNSHVDAFCSHLINLPGVPTVKLTGLRTFNIKNNTWCFTNFWAGTWFPPTGKDREMAKQTVLSVQSSLGLIPLDIEILRKCKQETFDPI